MHVPQQSISKEESEVELKHLEIGYHLGIQLIRICGWDAAVEALKDAGNRYEARGIFRALRENANGRSLVIEL